MKTPSVLEKAKTLIVICTIALCIIVTRLFYLQISLNKHFLRQGTRNFTRIEERTCMRGNITDCNGVLLATNRPTINVIWNGSGNSLLTNEQNTVLAFIGNQCPNPELSKTAVIHAERYRKQTILARDISVEQLSTIAERYPNHANISIEHGFTRFYPNKSLASHIIGYFGHLNNNKSGLEQAYEHVLQGSDGVVRTIINSFGKTISEHEIAPPLPGGTLQVTLDASLQRIAERIFPANYKGALIVIDPATGDLKVVASRPTFDPNVFTMPITSQEWNALIDKKPFINRAFNATYPPGSIFKLITIAAALESKLITQQSTWNCRGFLTFAKRRYHCWKRCGHGVLDVEESLAQSCNIMCFDIARSISIDTLAYYAYQLGLGAKTQLSLPEKEGLIPTNMWKRSTKNERWWAGETLSASIGQSYLSVTPIQIACMISSIFSGKLVRPRLLTSDPIVTSPIALSQETIQFLRKSMGQVVNIGTGRRVRQLKDFVIYGKTSTAQISDYVYRKSFQEHGWFVAHFQYGAQPPLVMVVLVENASNSAIPTTVAKQFLYDYRKQCENKKAVKKGL